MENISYDLVNTTWESLYKYTLLNHYYLRQLHDDLNVLYSIRRCTV